VVHTITKKLATKEKKRTDKVKKGEKAAPTQQNKGPKHSETKRNQAKPSETNGNKGSKEPNIDQIQ
jgi:hypothetical protein